MLSGVSHACAEEWEEKLTPKCAISFTQKAVPKDGLFIKPDLIEKGEDMSIAL